MEAGLLQGYDKQHGGFGDAQHFIQADTMEWALERSRPLKRNADTDVWKDVASRTLTGARKIIDPVWGGMFQYSDKMDWSGPHFEKLKSHLKIAYVKDVKREGRWVPFGTGDIGSTGYFKLLRELNYPAPVSLHIEFDWTDGGKAKTRAALVKALQESAQVLRRWLASA